MGESIKSITERVRKEREQGINGGTDGATIEVQSSIKPSNVLAPEVET